METETVTFTPPPGMTTAEFRAMVTELFPGAVAVQDDGALREAAIESIKLLCSLYEGNCCNLYAECSPECRLCRAVHGETK